MGIHWGKGITIQTLPSNCYNLLKYNHLLRKKHTQNVKFLRNI